VTGTWARYGLGLLLPATAFPMATFLANVAGSFLLALVYELSAQTTLIGPTLRLGLGVGVMGGFTSYSSFDLEVIRAAQAGQLGLAAGYFVGTVAACGAAGLAGTALVRWRLKGRK
jgi:CrcB protein